MQKQWIFPEKETGKNIIKTILRKRGIIQDDELTEFLSENPRLTYDPFLLKNMNEASDKILETIDNNKKICIYGDYDADGICSVSLLIEILNKLKAKISYYIPSRFDEGYGLNIEAIEKIKEDNIALIITVDCGSVSYNEVELVKELGMDIIVTDHHNLNDKPVSCLLINPKQKDCMYPEKQLSGCGVAFKLAQALQRKRPDLLGKADLNKVLDLVAIATIGDIVALSGENRTMVKYGLKTINRGGRPGLALLTQSTGLKDREIKSDQIAYVIVPHLNAAGRMLSAEAGVRLLTSGDEVERREAAEELLKNNKERKRIQELIYKEAIEKIEKLHIDDKFFVLEMLEAHEGITGIVAGKIKDRYNRPVVILTMTEEKMLKGTGRSIEGINLYDMLSRYHHIFEKFGGHAGACGFTMKAENLDELRLGLGKDIQEIYEEDPTVFLPKLVIDAELDALLLDKEFVLSLEKLEPFGHKNPKPVFSFRRANISEPHYMGEDRQHVRFGANGVNCVYFNDAERLREFLERKSILDLAGYPEINYWNGYEKVQFIIEDIDSEVQDG